MLWDHVPAVQCSGKGMSFRAFEGIALVVSASRSKNGGGWYETRCR